MENALKLSALGAASMLFVAPLQDFEEVRRSRHVGERSVFPFVCMWCSSSLWVIYGLYIGDIVPTVATNLVGLVFSMYYCVVFAWAVEPASRKTSTYNLFAVTFLVVCSVITFCLGSFDPVGERPGMQDANSGDDGEERVQRFLGTAASVATTVQYASPLVELFKVMRRRSTEGMSFALAVVSLVCSLLWLCYGVVVVNAFIYVPNVLGVCFSSAQCGLFWMFPRKAPAVNAKLDDPHKGAV
ncbi:unnamed protein product [Scytosiphon promiscuus]